MSVTLYPASIKFNDGEAYHSIAAFTPTPVMKFTFTNVAVASSAFASDSTYNDYPYRASIDLPSVTSSMIPEAIFNLPEAADGLFAPICMTYNGGIYIYSIEIPENSITIPTIMCWLN